MREITHNMPWTALAAAEIGPSHARKALPCQDACRIAVGPLGMVLGALADGVGTATHSDTGAQLAVSVACARLLREEKAMLAGNPQTVRTACAAAMAAAVDTIRQRAVADGNNPNDYACTLILLIVAPKWIAAMGVGDGFVTWRAAGSAQHELLVPPEKGEFINYTTAITSADFAASARFEIRAQPPAFALASSDGLLFLALKAATWKPHAPFFEFAESLARRPDASPELLRALLRSPQAEELSEDDKSLLVVSAKEHAPVFPMPTR